MAQIAPEILDKYYGCGVPIPPLLNGCRVLDLGCGTGRDVYVVSKLVAESGEVIGIDMTPEQLEVANKYREEQAFRFGFSAPNTRFVHGYIEDLASAGIESNTIDAIISNCVINLSPDKAAVYREIFRVLKPGGELYISDVFSDRRIPDDLQKDSELYGECLSGALYIEDFRRLLSDIGVSDYRTVSQRPLTIENAAIERKLGAIKFQSITVRAFKLDLEDQCEDYGQVATYLGGIDDAEHWFALDDHHRFELNKPVLVCGNTADMISQSRYGSHFRVDGKKQQHFGLFDCAFPAGISNACC